MINLASTLFSEDIFKGMRKKYFKEMKQMNPCFSFFFFNFFKGGC